MWDVPQIAGLHHVDDLLQRGTPDDFVLRLRIVADKLPKNYDHVIVNFDREGHATDAGSVKNFQQRLDSFLVFGLSDALGELFLVL